MTSTRPRTRVIAAIAVTAALGIAASACSSSSGSDPAEDTKVSVGAGATSVDASTTTEAPKATTTTTTTTKPPVALGTATPLETSQRLYDAWKANDKVTAATVADPAALAGMWKTAPGDYSVYNACDTGEFESSGCLFRGSNGTIQFDLERRGTLWVAVDAFYSEP